MNQTNIDDQNSSFWNELCGSYIAPSLGITEINSEALEKFDHAYFDYYPYLQKYVMNENLTNKKVLELGLGFGTLGEFIATQNCDYLGLDIAPNAVNLMNYRLSILDKKINGKAQIGSALDIPYPDSSFDYVYSIGCLHHTGNLKQAIDEVYRVLRKNGKAIIMLYNLNSFRQFKIRFYNKKADKTFINSLYDINLNGDSAPHIDYLSTKQCRELFINFESIKIDIQNFDPLTFKGKTLIKRSLLLNNIGRILGLDLYIVAKK